MLNKEYWEKKHKESKGRYNQVTDFARFCLDNFIKNRKGTILDLGCGKGADAIFFCNKGMKVTALDYSNEAINQFNEMQRKYNLFIQNFVMDMSKKLPFSDSSFDYVYIRASLHYFSHDELQKIFSEIHRLLKEKGLLMFQVKSTDDKDYGKGNPIEKDMYEDEIGYIRHFFSTEYAEKLLESFSIIMLEQRKIRSGSAYIEAIAEKK